MLLPLLPPPPPTPLLLPSFPPLVVVVVLLLAVLIVAYRPSVGRPCSVTSIGHTTGVFPSSVSIGGPVATAAAAGVVAKSNTSFSGYSRSIVPHHGESRPFLQPFSWANCTHTHTHNRRIFKCCCRGLCIYGRPFLSTTTGMGAFKSKLLDDTVAAFTRQRRDGFAFHGIICWDGGCFFCLSFLSSLFSTLALPEGDSTRAHTRTQALANSNLHGARSRRRCRGIANTQNRKAHHQLALQRPTHHTALE